MSGSGGSQAASGFSGELPTSCTGWGRDPAFPLPHLRALLAIADSPQPSQSRTAEQRGHPSALLLASPPTPPPAHPSPSPVYKLFRSSFSAGHCSRHFKGIYPHMKEALLCAHFTNEEPEAGENEVIVQKVQPAVVLTCL